MAVKLAPGDTVSTTTPQLAVEGMATPGVYTFKLIVVDAQGIASQPALFKVQVTKAG